MKLLSYALLLSTVASIFSCSLPNPLEPRSASLTRLEEVVQQMDRKKPGIFPASEPGLDGALGRNQSDGRYSTVRWQMDLLNIIAYGVAGEDTNALSKGILSIEYGQSWQNGDGGFVYRPIPGVSQTPTDGDLASGAAFYLASVGAALGILEGSGFFQNQASCAGMRSRVSNLSGSLAKSLGFLLSNEALLKEYDREAPNRLLFDAMAAMGLGRHLGNAAGVACARRFVEKALALQNREGWFKEGSGYDSSYQAVGAVNLFYLSMMEADADRKKIWQSAFYAAAAWEAGRVTPWGEVSVFGNSRVYPGGETFLGGEKKVAALSVAQCLFAAGVLFSDEGFIEPGKKVTRFYFDR